LIGKDFEKDLFIGAIESKQTLDDLSVFDNVCKRFVFGRLRRGGLLGVGRGRWLRSRTWLLLRLLRRLRGNVQYTNKKERKQKRGSKLHGRTPIGGNNLTKNLVKDGPSEANPVT
jgi:hypothetical protein